MDEPIIAAIRNPYDLNLGNTKSRKLAINAMCAHCMGCTEGYRDPGFVEEVRNCTAPKCPLWHFRPYQQKHVEGVSGLVEARAASDPVPEVRNMDNVDSSSEELPLRGSQ